MNWQLENWDELIGEGDIETKCDIAYRHRESGRKGYLNPEQFRRDLYYHYGIEHPYHPEFLFLDNQYL